MKKFFFYFLIILFSKTKNKKNDFKLDKIFEFNDNYTDVNTILCENIKISGDSMFSNYPRNNTKKPTFVKIINKTEFAPWPNNYYNNGSWNICSGFISIKDFEFDEDNNIYLLDEGNKECPIKLYKFDSKGNNIENFTIYKRNNDPPENVDTYNLVLDTINDYAYISYKRSFNQSENAGIFSRNLKDKNTETKELILNEKNFLLDENYIFPTTRNKIFFNIVLSCDGKYLLLCPLSSKMLYSIQTEKIREENKQSISINQFNAAYKNDSSSSLISGNLGNLYFTGLENNVIYIAEQIEYDLAFFDFKILNKIENNYESNEKPSKIFIHDGNLYIVYKNNNNDVNITKIYKTYIDNENSYVNKCEGLKYDLNIKSGIIWIFVLLMVIYIFFLSSIKNKQDRDINRNNKVKIK